MAKIEWIRLSEVDSTNTYAKEHVRTHNTAVLSDVQTQGKGRDGRTFLSHVGGMYLSLVRMDDLPVAESPRYMMAAPLAVLSVLKQYGLRPRIKWPNDVWVSGKKIAGILIESECDGDRIRRAVIGVGLNVRNEVSDVPCAATSMLLEGAEADVDCVAEQIARRLDGLLSYSLSELHGLMRKHLLSIGRKVTLPDGTKGKAVDLAEDGRLIVCLPDGSLLRVAAGDVTLSE